MRYFPSTSSIALTGFVDGDTAHGRSVALAIDKEGALLVADDIGDAVPHICGIGEIVGFLQDGREHS